MTAKEYLLDIGFDDAHLPELFNDDDKSHYQIAELMENYHQGKVKNLGLFSVSQQRELLLAFFDELDELPMGLMHYDREKVVEKFIANNCD